MTDRESFPHAVRLTPHDNTPRLVYADWLDDHAGTVACGKCGGRGFIGKVDHDNPVSSYRKEDLTPEGLPKVPCPNCGGSGRVPDADAMRAEFIRVQCELARMEAAGEHWDYRDESYDKVDNPKFVALRRRERELFTVKGIDWFLRTPLTAVQTDSGGSIGHTLPYQQDSVIGVVRRGFVDSVALSLEAFVGGVCEWCRERGDRSRGPRPGRVYSVQPNSYDEPCPRCHGTGRVERLAGALFREHPITAVTLSNRTPVLKASSGEYVWQRESASWFRSARGSNGNPHHPVRYDLPDDLLDVMGCDDSEPNLGYKTYDSLRSVTARLADYGRKLAGLPPLFP